jgi:hypothetical protein
MICYSPSSSFLSAAGEKKNKFVEDIAKEN